MYKLINWIELHLAMTFGEKHIEYETDVVVTSYYWRGTIYVTDIEDV